MCPAPRPGLLSLQGFSLVEVTTLQPAEVGEGGRLAGRRVLRNNASMNTRLALLLAGLLGAATARAQAPREGENPADHLPPHIARISWFGERADWSLDGKKILFLSKTFGDAMEIDLQTRIIRNLTAHYPHHGYTRALY